MDISSSAVKMVEVADAGKGALRVERYTIEPLPKDAVVDGNITNLEAVVETVKRGWKKLATRTKNVAMALPTAAVITNSPPLTASGTVGVKFGANAATSVSCTVYCSPCIR